MIGYNSSLTAQRPMCTAIQLINRSMPGVPRSGNSAQRGACATLFDIIVTPFRSMVQAQVSIYINGDDVDYALHTRRPDLNTQIRLTPNKAAPVDMSMSIVAALCR